MEDMNLNNTLELDEMRKQFALLQERLDRQVDINDQQMKKALKKGIGQMRGRDHMAVLVCFVGWVFAGLTCYAMELPLAFQLFVIIGMGINFLCSIFMKLHINDFRTDGMASADLLRTSQELIRYKRNNQNYMKYVSIPYIIVFVGWFTYLIMLKQGVDSVKEFAFVIIPMLVGAFIGGMIGVMKFYRPSIRQADEMLAQIKELQE